MTQVSEEILGVMRSIVKYPTMHGTPESLHGEIVAFSLVILRQELGPTIGVRSQEVEHFVRQVTEDVLCSPSQYRMLCDACLLPDRNTSYEAFSRHANRLLDVLLTHVESAKGNPSGESQQGWGVPDTHFS